MSEHHVYEPWPGSATGLPVCKFCGQPPNALIHTVPLEVRVCRHPYNSVSDAGVCGDCGVHLTIKVSPISAEALATERERWREQTDDLYTAIEKLRAERDRLRAAETEARTAWRAESHDISEQAHEYRVRAEKAEAKLSSRGFAEPDRHDFKAPPPRTAGGGVSPFLCDRCGEPPAAYIHRPPTPEPQQCPVDCEHRCHHTTQQEVFASELSFAWNQVRQARAERDELRGKVQEP